MKTKYMSFTSVLIIISMLGIFYFVKNTIMANEWKKAQIVENPPGNAIPAEIQEMLMLNFIGASKQSVFPKQLYSDDGAPIKGIFFDKVSCDFSTFQLNEFGSSLKEKGYTILVSKEDNDFCYFAVIVSDSFKNLCRNKDCRWSDNAQYEE